MAYIHLDVKESFYMSTKLKHHLLSSLKEFGISSDFYL